MSDIRISQEEYKTLLTENAELLLEPAEGVTPVFPLKVGLAGSQGPLSVLV